MRNLLEAKTFLNARKGLILALSFSFVLIGVFTNQAVAAKGKNSSKPIAIINCPKAKPGELIGAFGIATAIAKHADIFAVGAYCRNKEGDGAIVYIYKNNNDKPVGVIGPFGRGFDSNNRKQLALSDAGNTIVFTLSDGAVYAYSNINGVWKGQKITSAPGAGNAAFITISPDGKTVAFWYSLCNTVYVYARSENGGWTFNQKIQPPFVKMSPDMKFTVDDISLSNNTLVISGHRYGEGIFPSRGYIFVYSKINNKWEKTTKGPAPQIFGAPGEFLGANISFSGNTLAATASKTASSSGGIYMYDRKPEGKDSWKKVKTLDDYFGTLHLDSGYLAVSRGYYDPIYLFSKNDQWEKVRTIKISHPGTCSLSCCLSDFNNKLLVGLPQINSPGFVYIYKLHPDASLNL